MSDKCNYLYLEDEVSNCHSFIFHMDISFYLSVTEYARHSGGNIEGQRPVLKSQSARIIRDQMTTDFRNGGVLPPVVIGMVDPEFDENNVKTIEDIYKYIDDNKKSICIIDGMQRTEAMINAGVNTPRNVRVELWLVESLNKLIYRMLVLNTGQVPWTMQKQLEVVMNPVIKTIQSKVPGIELPTTEDAQRRTQAGKFQASKIIESFLVFGARSEKINTRDSIAEEYAKLDFIESSSKQEILDAYIEFLRRIYALDVQLCRINRDNSPSGKFKKGCDILGSQPALIGITTAFAIKILGRPKLVLSAEQQTKNMRNILSNFDEFIERLEGMNEQELTEFINLESLNSMSPSSASTKVGDQERQFFKGAFNVLLEDEFKVPNMDVCWGH
ncbi:hypothetical protein [Pantoea septica]|uniref:hypothetical protein n=1 Tax=Pantoea septica TaxID=472695 RepID=UPI0028AE9B4B|nr:hypothetical protein [Pantoea septica]